MARAQQAVLDALEVRFGAVPAPLQEAVPGIESPEALRALHRRGIVVESLAAFERELGERDGGGPA